MTFGDELRSAMDNEMIEPPKGPYKARLHQGEAFIGKKDQELCKLTFQIVGGDHDEQRFEAWLRFGSPKAKEMSAEALAALGVRIVDLHTIDDLDDQLTELVKAGTIADVSVSYGGDEGQFLNVKIHGSRTAGVSDIPTNGGQEQPSFAAATGAQDDDKPLPF